MDAKVAHPDERIARLASRQHGVVALRQLHELGVSRGEVRGRVGVGRLHRLHQGVYAVGHVGLSQHGTWLAAVLACGGATAGGGQGDRRASDGASSDEAERWSTALDHWGAALSHRSAAGLWQLLPPDGAPVDVSVPTRGGRARRPGIRLHRSISLLPAQVTLREGIPVTTPARTIADLRRVSSGRARLISTRELGRAIRQANVLGLPVETADEHDRTRSDLESDFLELCRRHRLPAPEVNVRVGPHLVDFLWRDRRLVVETDGYVYHRGRGAFERDRERDLELKAMGHRVVRIADRQLDSAPERIVAVLRSELLEVPVDRVRTRPAAP